ncbi:hypothetical protein ACOME3_007061 [Neoechinorhynchus agilis]
MVTNNVFANFYGVTAIFFGKNNCVLPKTYILSQNSYPNRSNLIVFQMYKKSASKNIERAKTMICNQLLWFSSRLKMNHKRIIVESAVKVSRRHKQRADIGFV